jgi:hypothetical protein
MKTIALVCAAMMTFSASGYGMHKAGWFHGKCGHAAEGHAESQTRHKCCSNPFQSDAAMRYRQNQNINWRLVMALR